MDKIDWSKAPEGATHYSPKLKDDDMWSAVFWRMKNDIGVEAWQIDNDTGGLNHFSRPKWTPDTLKRMIARPVAWDGTGLPPVGTVCEVMHNHEWVQCEVVAHKDMGSVVNAIVWIDANRTDQSQGIRLRPIRTQEQIEAEEREAFALKLVTEMGKDPETHSRSMIQARKIFDLGYRKQEEPK